jgi:hypothetical protein
MTKTSKPEVEIKIWNFSNSRAYSGPTYQIWRFYVKPFTRY